MRFWNAEIYTELDEVLEAIYFAVAEKSRQRPDPLPGLRPVLPPEGGAKTPPTYTL